jgi:hypothetical protein
MNTKADDPSHKQKSIYSLTDKAIDLLPVLAMIGDWGTRHLPVSEELSIRAKLLAEGGPAMWRDFMAELREAHLGTAPPAGKQRRGPGVRERLQAAFEEVRARQAGAVKAPRKA